MPVTTQFRVHEAPGVACSACGAPLPVDPTAPHVWCPACHRWQGVAPELRARAFEHLRQTEELGRERAAHAERALAHQAAAKQSKTQSLAYLLHGGLMLGAGLLGLGAYAIGLAASVARDLSRDYEPWAVALIVGTGASAALIGVLALGAGSWAVYRLYTRHRRIARRARSAEWFSAVHGSAGAMCGECGAPVAFRVGETAVTCGFCRAVVTATTEHSARLIRVALGQAQLARLEHAKAERRRIKAELTTRRRQQMYMAYAFGGTLAFGALPIALALYVWRTLTPSIEEAMLVLAQRLSGEFGAGIDMPFDWLDAYWIGDTPEPLRETGPFQSRWSIEAVFHDRPVLVTCTTSWSDRQATRLALLLTRPRDRSRLNLAATPAAARARARGFSLLADYAGITLEARNLDQRSIDDTLLTELAQAAYELGEER